MKPEYLAFKECQGGNRHDFDSLMTLYEHTHTFILTIGPGKKSKGDVMTATVNDYEDYKELFDALNFRMNEFISLSAGEEELELLNFNLENTYGLTDYRNIYLVFSKESPKAKESMIKLSFDGDMFGVGKCNYLFDSETLNTPVHFQLIESKQSRS
ncbi:MAG: hypothetical protein GC178_16975 [Flavobacteriales bacterium]|nr:hypothetical protein [Flavobacteriales bacterium]